MEGNFQLFFFPSINTTFFEQKKIEVQFLSIHFNRLFISTVKYFATVKLKIKSVWNMNYFYWIRALVYVVLWAIIKYLNTYLTVQMNTNDAKSKTMSCSIRLPISLCQIIQYLQCKFRSYYCYMNIAAYIKLDSFLESWAWRGRRYITRGIELTAARTHTNTSSML